MGRPRRRRYAHRPPPHYQDDHHTSPPSARAGWEVLPSQCPTNASAWPVLSACLDFAWQSTSCRNNRGYTAAPPHLPPGCFALASLPHESRPFASLQRDAAKTPVQHPDPCLRRASLPSVAHRTACLLRGWMVSLRPHHTTRPPITQRDDSPNPCPFPQHRSAEPQPLRTSR